VNADILPAAWREFIARHAGGAAPDAALKLVAERRGKTEVYPPCGKLFRAFELTPPETVRVVIVGQDPYHNPGEAEGLAFSVPAGVALPPSLKNLFKEYAEDLHRPVPAAGSLEAWARGGVLLLNAILSVDAHTPASHRDCGWEPITDAAIRAVSAGAAKRVAFILWGNYARNKKKLIGGRHYVLEGAHPSPLSAYRGFFGSRPFSQVEAALGDWRWPQL
jgi:uracil-DNA glycosylase